MRRQYSGWIASCQALFISERMISRELLEDYMRAASKDPEETARRIE
jgi:hypothetical protein